jgi:hypothetical protein
MNVTQTDLNIQAGLFAFDKAKDIKSQEILGALGMTPETQKAQLEIDESIRESVANAIGQGIEFDIKA